MKPGRLSWEYLFFQRFAGAVIMYVPGLLKLVNKNSSCHGSQLLTVHLIMEEARKGASA